MNTCTDVVLLVDDNEIDIFINKRILEFNNFSKKIIAVKSGREALDLLETNVVIPAIIFLDLNMPIIDGFRFLYEFSHLPKKIKDKISIVVLSSSDNDRDKEKVSVNPDVINYISKPLTDEKVSELRQQVEFRHIRTA